MPATLITNTFQLVDTAGLPVSGGRVEFYEPNGSSIPKAVYSDKALKTSVGTTAALNALGMFNTELFASGDYYMIVKYANLTTAYDMEYIEGEGSGGTAAYEWVTGVTPTFIGTTSFSVAGDLTSDYHANRRLKSDNTGGTIYSTIVSSAFTTLTTVTVVNDSGVLDSGLSSVDLGFLRADNPSTPLYDTIQAGSSVANKDLTLNAKGTAFVNHSVLSSTVSGSAATGITISSLVIPANREIVIDFNAILAASSDLRLVLNGDTTVSNYEEAHAVDGTSAKSDTNDIFPVGTIGVNDTFTMRLVLMPNSTSGVTGSIYYSFHYDDSLSVAYTAHGGIIYKSSAAITSIGIVDGAAASSLGIGSRISIKLA